MALTPVKGKRKGGNKPGFAEKEAGVGCSLMKSSANTTKNSDTEMAL